MDRVSRQPATTATRAERIWGVSTLADGFLMTPSRLIRGQADLGLTPIQFSIAISLLDFWWEADRVPFPSKRVLAQRIGVSARTIQRNIAELERRGFVKRRRRWSPQGEPATNEYDLSGLVQAVRGANQPETPPAEEAPPPVLPSVRALRARAGPATYQKPPAIGSPSRWLQKYLAATREAAGEDTVPRRE